MYPNNPDDSIANFIIYPYGNGWELYLHEDMNKYGRAIERCIAVTETLKQMLDYLDNKIDGLKSNDIPIKQTDSQESRASSDYIWIVQQYDGSYCAFHDYGPRGREFIDEDQDIDMLLERLKKNKDVILSF